MPRVMIVENPTKPHWSAKKLLRSINFEIVLETSNGFEAIEKYGHIKPDFVLLDLNLTKNDGLSVLKEIKKINPEAKIIILTTLNDKNQLEECIQFGSYAVVRIPFKMKSFLELVNRTDLTYENHSVVAPIIIDEPA